jgi:hypothetical protein
MVQYKELTNPLTPVWRITRRTIQRHSKHARSTVTSGAAPLSHSPILFAVLTLRPLVLLTNSPIKVKMSMQQWRNDTDKGKPKYWEKNPSQCHLFHQKYHMD